MECKGIRAAFIASARVAMLHQVNGELMTVRASAQVDANTTIKDHGRSRTRMHRVVRSRSQWDTDEPQTTARRGRGGSGRS